jgi:succinate dehydrogenase flavin-adding protein (antitoxin of CptAB toxin-antitoxin module)
LNQQGSTLLLQARILVDVRPGFLGARLIGLATAASGRFEALLGRNDTDLFDWIIAGIGQTQPPAPNGH